MTASPSDCPSPAVEAAYGVADDSVRIAQLLTAGEVVHAMDGVIALVDALGALLAHVQSGVHALRNCEPHVRHACVAYADRLDALLSRLHDALCERDLVGLALALEHGVAKALREYAPFDRVLVPATRTDAVRNAA
ncbi:MAG: hypothetical protein AAF721_27725 [Myxococcota bacterium]